jgi:predicted dehydrogenase
VDVVYIGAIHPAHLEICKIMFNAGKHILCEKVESWLVFEEVEI